MWSKRKSNGTKQDGISMSLILTMTIFAQISIKVSIFWFFYSYEGKYGSLGKISSDCNVICMLYNFCFAFKSADHLKIQESSQTFAPLLKNAFLQDTSSVFGPSWNLMKWVGMGSSRPADTQTQVPLQRLSRGFSCLRISKAPVTPEASGLGRGAQAHRQLQEDLILLRPSLMPVSLQGCLWCPEASLEPILKQLSMSAFLL